jgi:hypothetical protein
MSEAIAPRRRSAAAMISGVFTSPAQFVALMLVLTTAALAIDQQVGLTGQNLLGVAGWIVLVAACLHLTPLERSRVAVVIMVATLGEVIGSVIWGAYEYRLGNLPLFVPPGHGLVYLTGLAISQLSWPRRHPGLFVRLALTALLAWAAWGLLLAERTDVAGAIGAGVLALFLLRGTGAPLYAGVFLFVAYLELYGTWVGTWTWAEYLPGTPIPDGNPPSGIAAGYVLFDIAALAFAPALLAAFYRARGRLGLRRLSGAR